MSINTAESEINGEVSGSRQERFVVLPLPEQSDTGCGAIVPHKPVRKLCRKVTMSFEA